MALPSFQRTPRTVSLRRLQMSPKTDNEGLPSQDRAYNNGTKAFWRNVHTETVAEWEEHIVEGAGLYLLSAQSRL